MSYTYWITTALKGQRVAQVHPVEGNWTKRANSAGSGSFTFQVNGEESGLSPADWRYFTTLRAHDIVVCYNDNPVYTGSLDTLDYQSNKGTVVVQTSEFSAWLDRRLMYLLNFYDSGTITFSNMTIPTIIREIVRRTLVEPAGAWGLPVDLPAIVAGTETRTYFNYYFKSPKQAVEELQKLFSDVDFQPYWAADGTCRQLLRVGNPRLAAPTYSWMIDAEMSGATNISYKESAQKLVTGVRVVGAGSEADVRHEHGGLEDIPGGTSYIGPNVDTTIQMNSEDRLDVLKAHAVAYLDAHKEPVSQLTFDVLASGTTHEDSRFNSPSVDQLLTGSRLRTYVKNSPFVKEGWRENYLVGLSGSVTSDHVSLEVQEVFE